MKELKYKHFSFGGGIDKMDKEKSHYYSISLGDSSYPEKLVNALKLKTPKKLYYRGNLSLLKINAVGFCGSRNASEKGLETAQDCVEQISAEKLVVISGNANGVDIKAHYTALKEGGYTIFVLPEGIEHFRIKKELQDVWDWSRVLVLSQYEPSDSWQAYRAMERNKLIIALSDAMIVIEAGEKGGTIDAGKSTLKLGKPLYVAVYEDMQTAVGNDYLLRAGAIKLYKSIATQRAKISLLLEKIRNTSFGHKDE